MKKIEEKMWCPRCEDGFLDFVMIKAINTTGYGCQGTCGCFFLDKKAVQEKDAWDIGLLAKELGFDLTEEEILANIQFLNEKTLEPMELPWCPICDQGRIRKVYYKDTQETVNRCQECLSLWEGQDLSKEKASAPWIYFEKKLGYKKDTGPEDVIFVNDQV